MMRALSYRILLMAALSGILVSCRSSCPTVERPRIVPVQEPAAQQQQRPLTPDDLRRLAPGSFKDTDPDICASDDPNAQPAGGLSSRAVYEWPSQTHVDDLYARVWVQEKICTDQSLSSADRSRLDAALAAFGISKAQSFAASVSITGDSLGGIKYPDIVPFSYASGQGSYSVQTSSLDFLPWQATSAFRVQYSYKAGKTISLNTAQLFQSVVTQVAGAGTATAVLSPAANAYLSAGNTLATEIATSIYNANNTVADSFHADLAQAPPGEKGAVRVLTYRFQDTHKKPLAGVRLLFSFTRTIGKTDPVTPTDDAAKQPPQFTDLPGILNKAVGGPATGSQTLFQQISKERSYQSLLKTDSNTSPTDFKNLCDALETALPQTYGLNKYDTALAMGEVLSQYTPYLAMDKFYSSGCFQGRSLLKSMGINAFEHKPSS